MGGILWIIFLLLGIVLGIFLWGWFELFKDRKERVFLPFLGDIGFLGFLLTIVALYTFWGFQPIKDSPPASSSSLSSQNKEERDQAPAYQIFELRGCSACHSLFGPEKVGPNLGGLWGETVIFSDGTTLVADDSYLRESILSPGSRIVKGYPPLMPSYAGVITMEELETLINWLKSQK
jgi:cytochrome c2